MTYNVFSGTLNPTQSINQSAGFVTWIQFKFGSMSAKHILQQDITIDIMWVGAQ